MGRSLTLPLSHTENETEWVLIVRSEVRGTPITQGSMRAFMPKGGRFPIVTHNRNEALGAWRGMVGSEVRKAIGGAEPVECDVAVETVFSFNRPQAHYRRVKGVSVVRDDAPLFAVAGKDGDKLTRAVWDALTGVAYRDDKQVVAWKGRKVYCGTPGSLSVPGVRISVWRLR